MAEVGTQTAPRTYRCPQCGYDGFRMGPVKTTFPDVNIQPMCPACATIHGLHVALEETSDPRTAE